MKETLVIIGIKLYTHDSGVMLKKVGVKANGSG
jgi:hypothetical protein